MKRRATAQDNSVHSMLPSQPYVIIYGCVGMERMGALGCIGGQNGKFHPRHTVPVNWRRPDVKYEILHSKLSTWRYVMWYASCGSGNI